MKASTLVDRLTAMINRGQDFEVKPAFRDDIQGRYIFFDIGDLMVHAELEEISLFEARGEDEEKA